MPAPSSARLRAGIVSGVAGAAAVLALAACSASAEPAADATTAPDSAAMQDRGGISGEIAAVSDGLLQVQDAESQTAVSYDAATTISIQVDLTAAELAVGDCVLVITSADDESLATSVSVQDEVDGECAGGPGGVQGGGAGAGAPEGGFPTDRPEGGESPEDAPSGAPSGAPGDGSGGFGGFGGLTAGRITAVDGTALTVTPEEGDPVTVSLDDATTVTGTRATDSSALAVGLCVRAQGEADDVGGFAATELALSTPGDEGCTAVFPGGADAPGQNGSAPQGGRSDQSGTERSNG